MAKIVKAQGETFEFSFTATEKFIVTPEGVEVPDSVAAVMASRFAVEIEEAPVSEVVAEEVVAEPVVEAPVEPVVEAPVEVTPPEAPAEEAEAAVE